MKPDVVDYCFANEGMFLVPVEALERDGIVAPFRDALLERGAVGPGWVDRFDAAFSSYWRRATELAERAPQTWLPPRIQHVGIVTASEPVRVRPYFQPFHQSSWLLYASDFDPDGSTVEFGTYQFFQAERMGVLKQIVPAVIANLSYFLALDDAEVEDFRAGCRRTTRPDAEGFRALGKAMRWLRQVHHQELRPPTIAMPGSAAIPHTGLIVPSSNLRDLDRLNEAWTTAATGVFERHRASHATPSSARGAQIAEWLTGSRPPLLVTGAEGKIVWDPERPEATDDLLAALADVTENGEAGILGDLQVVGACNRRFLACARAVEELVDPPAYITEEGLSYVHRERKLVAYHVGPGANEGRLWQTTPPYERLMLAARTVHEWGHLAAESGWIRVPEERADERKAHEQALVDLLEEVHASGPAHVRQRTAAEVERTRAKAGSLGQGLLKGLMIRIEDYQANLLAHRLLDPDAMDTYVRNNVCCHWEDAARTGIYHQLARQAYELQYLRLARIDDPLAFVRKSTWLAERFLDNGVVTEPQLARLVQVVADICDCYAFDESRLDFTALA